MKLTDVKVNHMTSPMGTDFLSPVFTWRFDGENTESQEQQQCWFRIRMYADWDPNPAWDSGKIESREQLWQCREDILRPCTRYEVTITAGMQDGTNVEGGTWFETGFLGKRKWHAEWIGPDRPMRQNVNLMDVIMMNDPIRKGKKPEDSRKDLYPVVHMDRLISIRECPVISARIYASARGVYEIHLNGSKVGDQELAPEFSSYQSMLQYQTYDVTQELQAAQSDDDMVCLSVVLSDGYYTGRIGMIGLGYEYGDHNAVILEMDVRYQDGTCQHIKSDERWKWGNTGILYSDIFIGEKQDLSIRCGEAAHPVKIFDDDDSVLTGQSAQPLRVLEKIPVKSIFETSAGETILDFGKVMAGRVRIKACGQKGEVLVLDHTETLDERGNYYQNTPSFNCEMQDIFLLSDGMNELAPHFSVHGFRYVRITLKNSSRSIKDFLYGTEITAEKIGSDLEITGTFHTSDEDLNRLQRNIVQSQRSNFFSIPMDCPQRERAGWMGDIQVYGNTAMFNMDCEAFLNRWLSMVRSEQRENGAIPTVVPYSQGYQNMNRQFGSDTSAGWGDVCVVLPWRMYMAYGDKQVLMDNYEMMEKWMAFVGDEAYCLSEEEEKLPPKRRENHHYLWNKGFHYGDWLYPSAKGADGRSDAFLSAAMTKERVAPAMHAMSSALMEKICHTLGKGEREQYYHELTEKIRHAYAAEYMEEDGRILPELQGIYVLALAMRLVPEDKRKRTASHLVRLIHENGDRLDTGFLSTPWLLDVLCDNGYQKVAKTLLFQKKSPSWLYEVKMGATTVWENWDAISPEGIPSQCSLNHYANGCVGDFLYRRILGLQVIESGYRRFRIAPEAGFGLNSAEGTLLTRYGKIHVAWEDGKELRLTIPMGCSAVVILPAGREETFSSGSYIISLKDNEAYREAKNGPKRMDGVASETQPV